MTWLMLVVVAVLVGFAKTALPGLAVLAAALLASVLPAKESTGVLLLMLLVGDVMAITLYRRNADFATLGRLVPSVLVGVALGGVYLHLASDVATRRLIGAILLAMIALTLVGMRRRARQGRPPVSEADGSLLRRGTFGALAGFTTMVANAGGPVTSMYFLSAGFEVSRFLGTTAWFFFLVNLVKLPVSVAIGIVTPDTLRLDLLLAPVVVLSCLAGARLSARVPQRVFDPLVLFLTVVSSCWLLV